MKRILETVGGTPGKCVRNVRVALEQGPVSLPVRVARGRKDGPVLVAAAGEHGTEVNGIAVIDRIFQEVSCDRLRGTLVAVPAINPWNVRGRGFPPGVEDPSPWDTCYRWPGDVAGTPAERITATLAATVMDDADVVINIHAWSWYSSSCAFTWRGDPRSVRLAKVFGLPFVDFSFPRYCEGRKEKLHPRHNMLTQYILSRGKSAMLVELRTHHWQFPESVAAGLRGLRNVMISLGMLPGEVSLPTRQFESTGKEEVVRASHRGLYVPLKEIGDRVRKDEMLGYLLDMETGRRTEVKSPCAGGVWLNSRVGPGQCALEDLHSYADRGDMLAMIKHIRVSTSIGECQR